MRATICPFKIFARIGSSQEVKGTLEGVTNALNAAYLLRVHVINMSLGCFRCSHEQESQQQRFYSELFARLEKDLDPAKRPVIVAATGNDGERLIDSPAALPQVIAVGSLRVHSDGSVVRSEFSNYGSEIDFVAPGAQLATTLLGGTFGEPEHSDRHGRSKNTRSDGAVRAVCAVRGPAKSTFMEKPIRDRETP
jgi:hypothetical protein